MMQVSNGVDSLAEKGWDVDSRKAFGNLGLSSLILVWGPPSYSRRSRLLAKELGMELALVYFTDKQGFWIAVLKYLHQSVGTLLHLARRQPDMVIVQNPPIFAALFVYVYCLFSRAKFIIDTHTDALTAPWWTWAHPLHRFLSRRAITTLVTNEALRQVIAAWGAPAFVLRDIPTDFPKKPPAALANGFNVVLVSTFSYDEPIEQALGAARGLPDVHLYVTGKLKNASPKLISGAPANVHFTDYLPDDDYYGLLSAAHAVMCLTNQDHTMQRGACEALSLGKPIITSDWPVLREYFSQGTLHVDNSAESIYRAICRMKDNLPSFQEGIKALRIAQRQEWQDKISRLVDLIQHAIPRS